MKTINYTPHSITAEKLISYMIGLVDQQLAGNNPTPAMIWGAPGIGKSDIIRQVAKQRELEVVDIRLAQREPIDMRGLPVPDHERKTVEWYISGEWPRDNASKGIIFFDEITAADRMNQAAAYELILDRKLGALYSIPPGWYICAAGNRICDHAVATPMSSALANRFLHFNLEPDVESWCNWAGNQGLAPSIPAFLRFRPEMLHAMPENEECQQGWPSPRTWERVSYVIGAFPQEAHRDLIIGLVGEAAATEFMAFLNSTHLFEPDVRAALEGLKSLQIPKKNDQLYAWCASASEIMVKEQKSFGKLLDGFMRLLGQLPADYRQMALQSLRGALLPSNLRTLQTHKAYLDLIK